MSKIRWQYQRVSDLTLARAAPADCHSRFLAAAQAGCAEDGLLSLDTLTRSAEQETGLCRRMSCSVHAGPNVMLTSENARHR